MTDDIRGPAEANRGVWSGGGDDNPGEKIWRRIMRRSVDRLVGISSSLSSSSSSWTAAALFAFHFTKSERSKRRQPVAEAKRLTPPRLNVKQTQRENNEPQRVLLFPLGSCCALSSDPSHIWDLILFKTKKGNLWWIYISLFPNTDGPACAIKSRLQCHCVFLFQSIQDNV